MSDPISAIARLIRERTDECADRALRRTLDALPAWKAAAGPLGMRADAQRMIELSLDMLIADRRPTPAELRWCQERGTRYAQFGLSLDDFTRALHIVFHVLWELLRDLAADLGDDQPRRLVERTPAIWSAFDAMTSAAADGHREVLERLSLEVRQRALAWLNALTDTDDDGGLAEALTRAFDLDPSGPFLATIHGGNHVGSSCTEPRIVVEQAQHTILIIQPAGTMDGEASMSAQLSEQGIAPAGIGLVRQGLSGARRSIDDARLAYRAAETIDVPLLRFRDAWLTALAVEHHAEHDALVADAVTMITRDARVAETLQAYLDADGNLSDAGKTLELHPNTVAYRLRQFAEHAGVDVRTADGRVFAQMVLSLVGPQQCRAIPHEPVTRKAAS